MCLVWRSHLNSLHHGGSVPELQSCLNPQGDQKGIVRDAAGKLAGATSKEET